MNLEDENDFRKERDDYNATFPDDEPVFATGMNNSTTVFVLREGVERFAITDIYNPAASSMGQSGIPIMWDGFAASIDRDGNYNRQESMANRFNHIPGGERIKFWTGFHRRYAD